LNGNFNLISLSHAGTLRALAMNFRAWTFFGFLALALLDAVSASALSGRLIRIIVPVPPGASTDFIARLMAAQIGATEGADLVVENRPGASGMIGTEFVSRQAPDGNTVLFTPGTYLIDAQIRKAPYNPVNDFEPLCSLVQSPTVLVVPQSSPYRTLADLLKDSHEPGRVSVGAIGPGSSFQLGLIELMTKSHTQMTFIPYPGSAPVLTDTIGGHISAGLAGFSVVSGALKTGQLRALAVASDRRIAPLPEVPTLEENGFPTVRMDNWFGAIVPAKTPADTAARLIAWLTAAMNVPEVKGKLAVQGLYPVLTCGSDFADLIRKRYAEYGLAIKQAGLKIE
jgi:tripartite-type tricarboxylate transporter receptor subunit TctC